MSILVVEDDSAVAELLRTLLNRVSGWGATVVHDAAAAREVFHYVDVDAMVLDINLPGISGLEMLDLMAADPVACNLPVVLTSANADQQAVVDALERHPNAHFVPKPFDVDELVEAIADAVRGTGTGTGADTPASTAARSGGPGRPERPERPEKPEAAGKAQSRSASLRAAA